MVDEKDTGQGSVVCSLEAIPSSPLSVSETNEYMIFIEILYIPCLDTHEDTCLRRLNSQTMQLPISLFRLFLL